jgi:hypothetical protein
MPMMNLEWAHVIIGAVSAIAGGAAGLIAGVWRVARIEGSLKLQFRKDLEMSERRIETKVDEARGSFDETLKGLRQKINDVELDTERRFLPKESFDDFREEYRGDIRRVFERLDHLPRAR